MPPQLGHMLRNYDPLLRPQSANLVDQLCPATDQPPAHAMQALQSLLSTVLAGTKRMLGGLRLSQIASASLAPFFCDFT